MAASSWGQPAKLRQSFVRNLSALVLIDGLALIPKTDLPANSQAEVAGFGVSSVSITLYDLRRGVLEKKWPQLFSGQTSIRIGLVMFFHFYLSQHQKFRSCSLNKDGKIPLSPPTSILNLILHKIGFQPAIKRA